jgi:HEAT repeat protein
LGGLQSQIFVDANSWRLIGRLVIGLFFALFVVSIICAPAFAQPPAGLQPLRAEPLYEQCSSLQNIGEAVAGTIASLKDKDAQKRVKAAETLAASCDARAVEPLVATLKDPEVAVRVAAVQALGQLGDRSAIELLIEAIGDEDWRVRAALARALCSFQAYASSNAALNTLANPAGKKITDEGDLRARCQAILMINQLRDVRFSRKAIGFLFGFLDYQDEKLRRIAQETALELKNTRNGFRELIGIIKQSNFPDFRRKAVYYLGKYKIEETLPILTEISIEDRDPVVRKMAKEAVESRN